MKMKKIMLGIMAMGAMSAVATAAAVTPNLPAAPETVVFENTQVGKIEVAGKLTSKAQIVKYAVFATEDNGVTKEDVLTLKDFVISQDRATNIFTGVNPKVMVKKINAGAFAELTNEKVDFKLEKDPAYSGVHGALGDVGKNWITNIGGNAVSLPTSLVAKTTLDGIVKELNALNQGTYSIDIFGMIKKDNARVYRMPNIIKWAKTAEGTLEVTAVADPIGADAMNPAECAVIEAKFATPRDIGNVSVFARIRG